MDRGLNKSQSEIDRIAKPIKPPARCSNDRPAVSTCKDESHLGGSRAVVSVATQDRLLVPANRSSIMQSRVRSDSSRLAHCIESAHRFDSVLNFLPVPPSTKNIHQSFRLMRRHQSLQRKYVCMTLISVATWCEKSQWLVLPDASWSIMVRRTCHQFVPPHNRLSFGQMSGPNKHQMQMRDPGHRGGRFVQRVRFKYQPSAQGSECPRLQLKA